MLKIGTKLKLIPHVLVDYLGRAINKPLPCEVVYINEAHRFFTVEFNPPTGGKFRESFKFEEE